MKFYNVHTHVAKNTPDEIRNVIFGWDDPGVCRKGYYCVGAHPLFYEWTKDFYSKLLKMCTPKAAVAVGECGFDKRSPMPFSEQTELFMTHVHVSEELRKPLMIHCVGFFNKLVRIKKDSSPSQPWIIHGSGKTRTGRRPCLPGILLFYRKGRRTPRDFSKPYRWTNFSWKRTKIRN